MKTVRYKANAPAVVLLSGGLDSAVVLALTVKHGMKPHALSFHYGQRHAYELSCASVQATSHKIPHTILTLPTPGGSALTDLSIDIPPAAGPSIPFRGKSVSESIRLEIERRDAIPVTYVPARNTVFLAHALAFAETIGADDIFLGVNAVDYSGYPDCRPAFIKAFETVANLATKRGVEGKRMRIQAPLIYLSKVEIVTLGLDLGVDFGATSSCYQPTRVAVQGVVLDKYGVLPCGTCDSCRIRADAFDALKTDDPARYARVLGGAS